MKTEYTNVKIPLNTIVGATVQALSAKNGTRLTRITADGRDDLVITRAGKQTVHLAWSQVKGGFLDDGTAQRTPQTPRGTDFGAEPGVVYEDVEPEDDTIELSKPRGRRVPAGLQSTAAVERGDDLESVLAAHEGEPEPVDDTVRLMAPKAKRTRKAKL